MYMYTYKYTYNGPRKHILNKICPFLISHLNKHIVSLAKKEQSSSGTVMSESKTIERLKTERGN